MGVEKGKNSSFFLIIIAAILLVSGTVVSIYLRTDSVDEALRDDQVLRVLFVVQDEDGGVLFSNVLIYYPVSNRAAIVNVPGNTGAIYASLRRTDRIDAVYKERGISVYRDEINSLLGMRIPFTVEIMFANFIKLIDLLGGVKVFIPEPVDVVDADGSRYLLPSGAVTLDGDKTVSYLTYSLESENDSAVHERYQNVMVSIFTSLSDRQRMIFPDNKDRTNFKLYNDCMNINLDNEDSYALFSMISKLNTEYIIRQNITGMRREVEGKTLLFPLTNGEFIKQVMSQTTSMIVSTSGMVAGRVYVLEVHNGTNRQGLARNTQVLFEDAGYNVLRIGNASNEYAETLIIDHIGNREAALMIGDFIRCNNVAEEAVADGESGSVPVADVDFTIILGSDFDGRYVRSR